METIIMIYLIGCLLAYLRFNGFAECCTSTGIEKLTYIEYIGIILLSIISFIILIRNFIIDKEDTIFFKLKPIK